MTKRPSIIIASLLILALSLALLPVQYSVSADSELFISEYIEGSSYNKALEIYNGTGAAVDLSTYTIELYSNGAAIASKSVALVGMLADGDVFVIAHTDADPVILAQADQIDPANSTINFNGDDALVLKNGGVVIDVIGRIGELLVWGSGDITTQNHTLRRQASIMAGDADGSDAFDPAVEWDGFVSDTFDGLGSHSVSGPDYTPIYDIQYTTDPLGDSPYKDQVVTTEGIVTLVLFNGYFIEDPASGAWSGLYVYDSNGPMPGDRVRLTGTLVEYYNLTELKDLTEFVVESSDNAMPAPAVVATGSVSQEQWESVLLRVENVTVTNGDLGYGEWTVDDGSGVVTLDDKGAYTYVPTTGDELTAVIGPLDYGFGAFKILPRDDNDIVFGLGYTPIYDIQYTADASGDSPLKDQADVTTEGIVTALFYNGYFIEDPAGGAWNGLWVYDTTNDPARGDRVRLTGTVAEYYGLTQLKSLTGYEVLSSGNAVPEPEVLPSGSVAQEQWEGVLVRVENVSVTDDNLGYGEWSVSDGSGDVVLDDKGSYSYAPSNGQELAAVIGPLDYAYGAFKIQPRDDNDILLPLPIVFVINEFLADPASGLAGDANGDGVRHYGADEFVEIVNVSDSSMDISGWTLADGSSVRHVFPAGTVVPADCTIVVFGGGSPNGTFGAAVVQTASTGELSLNNDGDSITLNDGSSDRALVEYGSEGGDNQSLTLDPDVSGAFVKHSTAYGSGGALFSPGTHIDGSSFAGCSSRFVCGNPATPIYEVQGSGSNSPYADVSGVVIEGVVVGDFQTSAGLRGFFIQEEDSDADGDTATSDGVFVYDGSSPAVDLNVGDLVRVKAKVVEYYGLTEMTSVSDLLVCGTGVASPAPVTLPVASMGQWEQYEGMLIHIPQTLYAVGNYYQGRYGEVDLAVGGRLDNPTNVVAPGADAIALQAANDLRRIQLEDGRTSPNPDPVPYIGEGGTLRTGDSLPSITGVLHYSFGYYELHPTAELDFVRENARQAEPADVGGTLKVASFNVLNYFTTLDNSGPICGPSVDMDCRGADNAFEFERQRAKIIAAIIAMDADVVGLMEMENHLTDAALQDLVNGINDAAGPGTYDYVNTGPIGTDAIKVAFIFKPGAVSLVGDHAILDSSVDPAFIDTRNRPALAQTFVQNASNETFTAVVNHLKSKGSACDDLGDPDTGDGQGNCNLTRTAAAQALVNWLAADPTGSGDSDFMIIGDLNSYALEDPITAFKTGGYTDLLQSFVGPDAYSYVYMGQTGYLDHALANGPLTFQVTGVTEWHINADEPPALDYNDYNPDYLYDPGQFRASDHDPVVVGLGLDATPPVLEVSVTPDTLWSPNHKYVTVQATVNVYDNVDPNPTVELVSVTSNEPDSINEDDKPNDIIIVDDTTFELRAERLGEGDGRIYTITYLATDYMGNSTTVSVTVTVPHNQ